MEAGLVQLQRLAALEGLEARGAGLVKVRVLAVRRVLLEQRMALV